VEKAAGLTKEIDHALERIAAQGSPSSNNASLLSAQSYAANVQTKTTV